MGKVRQTSRPRTVRQSRRVPGPQRVMTAQGFALFDTAIGRCGIAWGGRGVVGVQLPEARELETRARMLERFPGARETPPPGDVQKAVDGIVELLSGGAGDLSAIALDMEGVPPFHRRVYEIARTIGPGATLSYGDVAARLGAAGSARAVGQALGRNPFAIVVPCHRVLAAGGKAGGFSANGGVTTKLRLLAMEGARADEASGRVRGEDSSAPVRRSGARSSVDPPESVADRTGSRSLANRANSRSRVKRGDDGALGFDPRVALEHVRASDAALARVIDTVGPFGLELQRTPSLFGALAEAIVYQQLTGKAAATIFGRVCALFPRTPEGPTAERILRTSDDKLRAAGLSRAKVLSLKDLARRAKDGEIPTLAQVRRMEDEAIIESLTEVRGIGRWTAEMLLIFRLGRPDVLPVDDYGIRKGFAIAFKKRELPARKEIEKRGVRWKPYRTVASWYLWRAVELAKK